MNIKQVIVVRKDLKLGKGKLIAQACHASLSAADKSKFKADWQEKGQKKIVVWCENIQELAMLCKKAKDKGLPVFLVQDAGLTQLKPGTKTCLGIGPAQENKIDEITGNLKLL